MSNNDPVGKVPSQEEIVQEGIPNVITPECLDLLMLNLFICDGKLPREDALKIVRWANNVRFFSGLIACALDGDLLLTLRDDQVACRPSSRKEKAIFLMAKTMRESATSNPRQGGDAVGQGGDAVDG